MKNMNNDDFTCIVFWVSHFIFFVTWNRTDRTVEFCALRIELIWAEKHIIATAVAAAVVVE